MGYGDHCSDGGLRKQRNLPIWAFKRASYGIAPRHGKNKKSMKMRSST